MQGLNVIEGDLVIAPLIEIEKLTKMTKAALFIETHNYALCKSFSEFALGIRLHIAKQAKLWETPSPNTGKTYRGFGSWVYGEFGISDRKGRYLDYLGGKILTLGLTSQKSHAVLRKLVELGWSKAYQILTVSHSVEDVRTWCRVAISNTEDGLKQAVSEKKKLPNFSVTLAAEGKAPLLVKEEAEEKGKEYKEKGEEYKEKFKSVATEVISLEEENPVSYQVTFSNQDEFANFQRAVSLIRAKTGVDDKGKILAMLGAYFVATNVASRDTSAIALELEMVLQAVEDSFGVRLAVVKDEV